MRELQEQPHLHTFLRKVHDIVKPHTYLEVGVQHGTSLKLAHAANRAYGIDPEPLTEMTGNQFIYRMKSDDFFDAVHPVTTIDLAFIDGLHHYEQALRDFLNIERFCHKKSVVIFDDVLPRNQEEAARVQCPGDWTGDVWKVYEILKECRSDLSIRLVDTSPTGTLIVTHFGYAAPKWGMQRLQRAASARGQDDLPVPAEILNRVQADSAWRALDYLKGMFNDPDV